ncbi:TonB-dependent receptor [Catenovulum agarivorans]|uniref:TonB-dependent receptor n=1 Tax=Catenovulum agarivorans TaxID=1172192 RepID=UPI000308155D|nr:TonB-dependent receptor [Catenovulum agarivorans]
MKNTPLSLVSLAVAAAVSLPNLAWANDEQDSMENIIVTGSRVIESIDEVPASITVISSEKIQQHLKVSPEIQSLLSMYVPGMAPDTGSSSNTGQTLRGRKPLVMIDGVPQSTPLRNGSLGVKTLDPSAIERIEIIKGATSIFGNGAAGGIINYITKKASKEQVAGQVSLSSRFSAVKLEESAGGRIEGALHGTLDKFSYLVTASYEENGVQRDAEGDILGLQYGMSDSVTQNYFTRLAYQFDQDKSLQMSYNFYSSQQKTDLGDVVGDINQGEKTYAIHVPKELQKRGKPQGPEGNTNFTLKYTDNNVFQNTQLTVDFYKQNIENVFFFSTSLANPAEGYDGGQSVIKSDKTGARATFNSMFDLAFADVTLIYGVDALRDVTSQPLVDGRIWVPEMDMKNLAGFVQSKWVVDDAIIFKLGVRQDNIDLAVDDYKTLVLCRNACSEEFEVKGDTLKYNATTYNAGVKVKYTPYFQPFFSYSQGADISDIGRLLRSATVTDIADIRTEASIIDNYEVGFTSNINSALRFEVAAYRSTSELGTTNSYDEKTGIYMPVRAPQRIWGYEALVDAQLHETLQLVATYSYVEGKNTEADVYLGSQAISPPKGTLSLNWRPTDALSVTLNHLYVGDRDRFAANAEGNYTVDQRPVESYQVTHLSTQYQVSNNLSAFMGVENLFNKDYFSARAQSYTYGGYNVKGLGTTVNLGVQYNF